MNSKTELNPRSFLCFSAGVFWRSQLYIDQPQFLKFNISVQRDALVGVYGRKGLPPSHTQVCVPNTHTTSCEL